MFSVHIEGQVDDAANAPGEEQALLDDLIAVVRKHDAKITYATGAGFESHDDIDLIAAAQADQPPETGGGGGEPPETFVQFVDGETFAQYNERLFSWNIGHPIPEEGQVPTAEQMSEAEFDALHAADAPETAAPTPDVAHLAGDVVQTRLAGETYSEYVARATAAGATSVLDEADWSVLTPTVPTA